MSPLRRRHQRSNFSHRSLFWPVPLEELPELYSAEQAMLDGCLVLQDGEAAHNLEAFREFADRCHSGAPGSFRIVSWYYGENAHFYVHDLHFDGNTYT